jgi:hypothetical protein
VCARARPRPAFDPDHAFGRRQPVHRPAGAGDEAPEGPEALVEKVAGHDVVVNGLVGGKSERGFLADELREQPACDERKSNPQSSGQPN